MAIANNNVIGYNGQLPWNIRDFPEDMKRFRELTTGHPVIMGRKTFESIGKPLEGRTNIVLTRGEKNHPGTITAPTLEDAIRVANNVSPDVYIIGGAGVYEKSMNRADTTTLEITKIKATYEGDTFFPTISGWLWQEVSRTIRDEYDFITYKRK